jgi:hypothetical protein
MSTRVYNKDDFLEFLAGIKVWGSDSCSKNWTRYIEVWKRKFSDGMWYSRKMQRSGWFQVSNGWESISEVVKKIFPEN